MSSFHPGQKVKAAPVRGRQVDGTFVAAHPSKKGDWLEIKRDGSDQTFRTRPSLVKPA